jgi:hypothetical protein
MNAAVKVPSRTSLEPSTLSEAMTFANMLARSTMVPRDFQGKPENILVAIQWGREIGLGPLQALQNIAVINGRPSVWGDAMLALVRGSSVCAYVRETIEGDGDAMTAFCRVARKGEEGEIVGTFSISDAKKAGLFGKTGPWTQYPKRMLQMRARGFALRDGFPDVLRGVISAEEAQDIPVDTFAGPTISVKAENAEDRPQTESIPDHPAPPKRTVKQFLDTLQMELSEAMATDDPRAAFDLVMGRDDVRKAEAALTNGAKERLDGIIQTAVAQLAERDEAMANSA